MKRAFQDKVKSVLSSTDINQTQEVTRPTQPESHRRVRTSAAMIGLALSMGTSSLLLHRQQDKAVAIEPGVPEPSVSTAMEAAKAENAKIIAKPKVEALSSRTQGYNAVQVYVVRPGQTLVEVAREKQVEVEALAALNDLAINSSLQPGQVLKLPVAVAQVPEQLQSVSQADRLQALASPEQEELLERMKQKRDQLRESLAQWRSESSARPELSGTLNPLEASQRKQQQGGTLEAIAYYPLVDSIPGVHPQPVPLSPSAVINANPEQPSVIRQTQTDSVRLPLTTSEETVKIPVKPSWQATKDDRAAARDVPAVPVVVSLGGVERTEGQLYRVNPGDTIDSIARRHQISKAELIEVNQLSDPNRLDVNQLLKIPQTAVMAVVPQVPVLPIVEPEGVQPETATAATEEVQADQAEIVASVPMAVAEAAQPESEQTQANEAPGTATLRAELSELRQKYAESTPEASSETTDTPSTVASRLPIQANPLPQEVTYQVRPGDTLDAIARRHNVSRAQLIQANQLGNPDLIKVGQVLRIPQAQTSLTNLASLNGTGNFTGNSSLYQGTPIASRESVTVFSAPVETTARPLPAVGNPLPIASSTNAQGLVGNEANQPAKDYVEGLMNDIARMRQKYENTPNSNSNPGAVRAVSSNPQSETNPTIVNPEFNPNRYTQTLQTQVQQLRSPVNAGGAARSAAPVTLPTTPAANNTPAQSIAVAPVNPSTYNPALRVPFGRNVAPELPPLAPSDRYLPEGAPAFTGYIWPAKGVLTSGYGWRWGRMHRGIDIAGPVGTPIFAAAGGVVDYAGWNAGGFGNLVDIRHPDGSLTRYAHNSRLLVRTGQKVEQGQQIAEMGSTGFSTGPHLHFEIHPAGQGAVNPMAFLPR